jgi:hypothetical protein
MNAKKGRGAARAVRAARPSGLSAWALLAVKGGSPGTTEAYRGAVRAFVAWAKDRTRGLGAEALAECVADLREQGSGARKLNRVVYGVKEALLQAALRAGMSARELALLKGALDPPKGAKRFEPDVQVVTPEERRLLLEALPLRVRLVRGPRETWSGASAFPGSCCRR